MDHSRRSYFQLTLVAATGVVFAFFSALFPRPIPQSDQRPNSFVITGSTSRATSVDVFFDLGYGIFPDQMSRQALPDSASKPSTLTFPLPAGDLYRLRFDPSEHDNISYWENAEIRANDGRVLHRFMPSDFIAGHEIDVLLTEAGRVKVVPTKNAVDPSLLLRLAHPIRLPVDSPEGRPIQEAVLGTQRLIALVLSFVGVGIVVFVLGKKKAAAAAEPSTPSRYLEAAVLLYTALNIIFFRRPSLFIAPQMFVEDGVIFFQQQWALGLKAILIPYSGYLHLIPRLTTLGSTFFPVSWTPLIFLVVAVSALLATVLKAASPRVRFPFAYWCALVVVCLPNGDEITAFLTNVHWWAGVILLLVGISTPAQTRSELARDLFAVILAGLSGPWAVLCAPLFVFKLWRHRTGGQIAMVVVLLVVAGVQMHFNTARLPALTSEFLTDHVAVSVAGLGLRLGGQLIGYVPNYYSSFGSLTNPTIPILPWEVWAFVGWLVLLVALPVRRIYRETHYVFIAFAVVMVASTIIRSVGWEYMLFDLPVDQRYVFIPLLLTFWLLIMAVDNVGWRRGLAIVFLAIIFIRNGNNFRMPSLADLHWSNYAKELESGEAATIPIFPAGWYIKVEARQP